STRRTCSRIRCSRPERFRASISRRSRWWRAVPGRWRCRAVTSATTRISPNMLGSRRVQTDLPPISIVTSMSGAPPDGEFRTEELMADVMSRLIGEARHVAVGAQSPIPAAAALLARARGGGRPYLSIRESGDHDLVTDGGRELFDCAGQGRIDVFFLSGAQIDGEANINLVSIGDYRRPKVRFPGSFGSGYLYFVVPRVILFRLEHSRRTLVEKVDFISAPGTRPANVYRPGGPIALVTPRCLFAFDREKKRFRLESLHPGHSIEDVIANTGFDFDRPPQVAQTPPPPAETLRLLREVVAPELGDAYPQFARSVFGIESQAAHDSLSPLGRGMG